MAGKRQFVKYSFFRVDPAWRRLPEDEREAGREEFLRAYRLAQESTLFTKSYSLVGIRGDCDFLVWQGADRLETFQDFTAGLLATGLGRFLTLPYSYLAMTRPSQYVSEHEHEGQDGRRLVVQPMDRKYLFVYPFVKTRAWYLLPLAERQEMMNDHIRIGHKYPGVKLNTTYSFGLDDQEFVVAFESDEPEDFLDLVMELRESQGSAYTLRDTPIFTCVATEPESLMRQL
jgi:chlorite dismutase